MVWWVIRIAQNRIKVDHAIKCSAGPDPFVDCLAQRFLRFRIVVGKRTIPSQGVMVAPISLMPRACAREMGCRYA